jgi:2-polyprenyl-3-methyl-5-hydroxy-6-metoxy-1,4-benzoquinol methylase
VTILAGDFTEMKTVVEDERSTVWDHSSDDRFYDYYAKASESAQALQRFEAIRDTVLRVARWRGLKTEAFDVADIGCGAGTQSIIWAGLGHHVHGLDVNEPLLKLAADRAVKAGYSIDFQLGSATHLPWPDQSMDVCLLVELIEHIAEWQPCLAESARVLRPGGILFLSTSNKLCPLQDEFNLPLYSWYPKNLKRYCEKLAVTTRPDLANYAKYPAVNWFSFYGLRADLAKRGLKSMDRFDVMDLPNKHAWVRAAVHCMQAAPALRWLGHVATPGTMVLGVKNFRA